MGGTKVNNVFPMRRLVFAAFTGELAIRASAECTFFPHLLKPTEISIQYVQ
jgi:hypothetical protein